jgi:hypothetical protein
MKLFIFSLLVLKSFISFSQDTTVVQFSFFDKKTGDAIPNVNCSASINDLKPFFLNSNQSGMIVFRVEANSKLLVSYSHPIYESSKFSKTIGKSNLGKDTLKIVVDLVSTRVQYIGEVIAKPIGVPTVIYGSESLSVSDFEIQKDGSFVLLAYPKRLKKGSEILLYNGKEVTFSMPVPNEAQELIRDFRGNTHVLCENTVYGIIPKKNTVQLSQIDRAYFTKYILPIVDTNRAKIYFSNFNKDYPAFDYFAFDQEDSVYSKIASIQDDLMMELYRSEYKWVDVRTKIWAKYKEIETGIDAEVWVGANYFTQSIYYKELYAPMFHRNDSLFIFDYYKDKLMIYSRFGEKLDSVPIYHHYQAKSTGWKKNVIQDQTTGAIYAHFEKDGNSYLGLIDTKTGEIKERLKLEYKYVDKIAINDGFVYYIYRPYESIQKKYLYNEKLYEKKT